MRGTFKFKGNKKLGNEFDPEITGEDGFDFDDYDTTTPEASENLYGGSDKVEGAGQDTLKNEFNTADFGTQNTQRMQGVGDKGFTSQIGKVPTKDLGTFKAFFPNDPEVRNLIDEVIEERQAKPTQNLGQHRNLKTNEVITSPMVGGPQGTTTAPINESQAPKYYTESEIRKNLSGLEEELGTINKYLDEVEDINPAVRDALSKEGADILENIEIEKAKMGVSIEQQAAADRLVTASKNELTEELIESGTVDVGKQTSEGFVDKTFDQTRRSAGGQSLTTKKGIGKSYVRDMSDLWGTTHGILGDAKQSVQYQKDKKGKTVFDNFPLDDKQQVALDKATNRVKSAEKALSYHKELTIKMQSVGKTPMKFDTDYAAETKRLENEVKNAKAQQTRILNNKQALAVDEKGVKIDAPKGGGGPKNIQPGGGSGAYGLTAEYQNEREKLESKSFEQQNPRVAAATKGAPDPGSPLGPGKIAASSSAANVSNVGNIEDSPAYKKKFTESYNRIAQDLTESAGGVFDAKNIDPAIAKRAAVSAGTIAAWFAKKNPGIGAGLMILGGLKNLDKKKDYTR
tara:strand:- start:886 stop:2598 length:1713 start_codon:yes stop_codon:yes gene_type:complete